VGGKFAGRFVIKGRMGDKVLYRALSEWGLVVKMAGGLRLSRFLVFAFLSVASICLPADAAPSRAPASGKFCNHKLRRQAVERLAQRSAGRKAAAWKLAKSQGFRTKWQKRNTIYELMAIESGRVYVYKTCNQNAAISIGADLVRNTAPYDVNGANLIVGIWDGGAVRPTHQELTGRVLVMDGASNKNHSTHVGGTVAAAGIKPTAQGMAPAVLIDSYEWNDDLSEMASRAMSYPNEPNAIQLSNHSYGYACGWDNSISPPHWYGTWGYRECDYFGKYLSQTALWDELCYNAPYFLPFRPTGNDRDDQAPADGELFVYYDPNQQQKEYDSSTDPCDDGWDNGGFDTILPLSTAKNVMTVGGVHDAVSNGSRDPCSAAMIGLSGWGPTDDGRIKPDIVTNAVSVYSSSAASDSSYAFMTGTSAAAPSATGAAALLVDYYGRLFPGQAMLASTIKDLMIHTADDLGKPGPDYKFGWGLVNTKAAADQIRAHYYLPGANKIIEASLDDVNTVATYALKWDGNSTIRATLCWTDPPATQSLGLDDPTPRLINDLDLRIIDTNSSVTYEPYVLDPANPNQQAATGDNILDNVEQVVIASANVPGNYTVQVSYKGTLTNELQQYSLILSGQRAGGSLEDLNGDGSVNIEDLAALCAYWLDDEPSIDIAPQGGDGIINFLDFAKLAEDWY